MRLQVADQLVYRELWNKLLRFEEEISGRIYTTDWGVVLGAPDIRWAVGAVVVVSMPNTGILAETVGAPAESKGGIQEPIPRKTVDFAASIARLSVGVEGEQTQAAPTEHLSK